MSKTPESTTDAAKRLLRQVRRADVGGAHQGKNLIEAARLLVVLAEALERVEALVGDQPPRDARPPAVVHALAEHHRRLDDLEARLVSAEAVAHRAAFRTLPIGTTHPGPHETVIPRVEAHVRDVPPQVRSSLRGMD